MLIFFTTTQKKILTDLFAYKAVIGGGSYNYALVKEGMLVWGTAPTMAGTVHHLMALRTAALRTEEATTESRSIKK